MQTYGFVFFQNFSFVKSIAAIFCVLKVFVVEIFSRDCVAGVKSDLRTVQGRIERNFLHPAMHDDEYMAKRTSIIQPSPPSICPLSYGQHSAWAKGPLVGRFM